MIVVLLWNVTDCCIGSERDCYTAFERDCCMALYVHVVLYWNMTVVL